MRNLTDDDLYGKPHRRSIRPGGLTLWQWLWALLLFAALGVGAASPMLWNGGIS